MKVLKNIFKAIGIVLLAFVFILFGQLLGEIITLPLKHSSNAGIKFSAFYGAFAGIWILVIVVCLICRPFRKMLPKLGPKEPGNNIKTALILGLILGLGLNLLVGITALINKDISISYSAFNPLMLIWFIVVVTIQSGAEELVTRWFIFEKIREYFPKYPAIAILVNALFFGMLHLFNQGVTLLSFVNLVVVGLLYSLLIYYYKSFWAAVVAHASWNFCQNIILGLPNSGVVTEYSIFSLDAASAKNSFTYNTGFGIEGTVMSCAVLLLACVVIFCLGRKKNKEKVK